MVLFGPRFLLRSWRAGIPLYTEFKSQYCKKTESMFQIAKLAADAINDTKLMMNPVTTGANSLHMRSILRILEFIVVSKFEECPSDITTTLSKFELYVTFNVKHEMTYRTI